LVQNVADALIKDEATSAGSTDQEFEKARLVADLAVAVEALQARGDTITEVAKLFTEETRRKRLWPLGRPGENVPFDPDSHDVEMHAAEPGTVVRVVRSGYVWRGGGEPIVAAKAVVAV
jgi:molecular chaperone GrpE (heat shock protein)